MRRLTHLTIFIILFSACGKNSGSTSRLLPEPDILERLNYQKMIIDSLLIHSTHKLIVSAKLINKDEPIQLRSDNFPDSVETTFSLLRDSLGRAIIALEQPFSESGDWIIILKHYFDEEEKTFAFEKQVKFFNSICTSGPAYETKIEFYDSDFQLIGNNYKLVDEKNKPLPTDSCVFNYNYDYKVSPNSDDYLQKRKIKNSYQK
jgi:hypothetical protein